MSALDLAAVALIAWRLAAFAVLDGGPFGVMSAVRSWAGVPDELTADGPEPEPLPFLGGLLDCVGCASFWAAPAAVAIVEAAPAAVVLVFAGWGAATALERGLRG